MNFLHLLAFTRIPGNACSFLLRRMIRWSRGKAVLHQEPKDDLFAYLNDGAYDAEARADELNARYDLEPLAHLSTRSHYLKNMYLLGVCRTYQFRNKWLPNLRFKNVKTFLNSLVPSGRICCYNRLILFK